MQVDKNLSFDQFSHDLTLALEETSKGGVSNRWGLRRRTRSTGNLPCPPQPTSMSDSSSANDDDNNNNENCNNDQFVSGSGPAGNSILSDSDDRHSYAFAFKLRQTPISSLGLIESDSLNENFSPSRPNIRRKRKFKRMAVEYENTHSSSHAAAHSIFPIGSTAKKRVLKHNQENFRGNLFFGKRKRSHRERYGDYESYKHSSSVPRQRSGFLSQRDGGLSYSEYKSRNRASSMSTANRQTIEKILPLNKSIISKIEKISQDSQSKMNFNFTSVAPLQASTASSSSFKIDSSTPVVHFHSVFRKETRPQIFCTPLGSGMSIAEDKINIHLAQKSGSFDSALPSNNSLTKLEHKKKMSSTIYNKYKQSRRLKLQFDDQNFMDCGINDFLSSSSLSSSDSEAEETNESDHEGDDELTDWPGHEVMVNFASKNEFKRANKKPNKLPQIKQDDITQDDDTLMSADEPQSGVLEPTSDLSTINLPSHHNSSLVDMRIPKYSNVPSSKIQPSHPINIAGTNESSFIPEGSSTRGVVNSFTTSYNNVQQPIESEMSGETSNFVSSPNAAIGEVREIRAGCRRIREERPGFAIITSFNEELLRFLQDEQQKQLKIFDTHEYEKLMELAKLYSLNVQTENGCVIINKTCNTMQAVRVSKEHKKYAFSDYKRRCVGGDTE